MPGTEGSVNQLWVNWSQSGTIISPFVILKAEVLVASAEASLNQVLQFGFITIFVAACPPAPLFALLNNWVEISLDAHRCICAYWWPVAEWAWGIGIWFSILEVPTHLAMVSKVCWAGTGGVRGLQVE
ncbi:hypothetical protein TURU_094315 [Turdus rufiventris]|nr:hypothetical protein TURU_094315 [Turdus rufiventris]